MNLFFVDSMTSKDSCGYYLAKKMGIKTAKRDVFLDNSSDPESIRKNLHKLVELAKKRGKAIGIGHAKKNTIMVLKEEIPNIKKEGVKLVILKNNKILSNLISSQEDIHSLYGGVVPELASRAHVSRIDNLFNLALKKGKCRVEDIDCIGVTSEPGLKGSLLVGVSFAVGLAYSLKKNLYKINC